VWKGDPRNKALFIQRHALALGQSWSLHQEAMGVIGTAGFGAISGEIT